MTAPAAKLIVHPDMRKVLKAHGSIIAVLRGLGPSGAVMIIEPPRVKPKEEKEKP